ncbi:unnamed protein product [Bathycoccus prasinos]
MSLSSMVVTSTFVNELSPPSLPFVFDEIGGGEGGGNGDGGGDGCADEEGHWTGFSGSQLQFVSERRYFS